MKAKQILALTMAAAMAMTLAACGQKRESAASSMASDGGADNAKTAGNASEQKVGLILGTGGLGDKNFNDMAYAGVMKAQEALGIAFCILSSQIPHFWKQNSLFLEREFPVFGRTIVYRLAVLSGA